MAKCSQSYPGLLWDMQEIRKVEKGQWGIINELGQHQLLTGQQF